MNINKQTVLYQLITLTIFLALPILFTFQYESTKLGIVQYEQSTLQKIKFYEQQIVKALQNWVVQKQQLMNIIKPNNPSFNQSDFFVLNEKLADKVESNSWVGSNSITNKINIISVIIHSDYEGDKHKNQKRIIKALMWFSNFYSMNLTFLQWNNTFTFDKLHSNQVLVIFQQFRNQLVQQNIANRLRKGQYTNQFYINEVVKEIRSTSLFTHCKYTNLSCRQQTILVMPEHPSLEGCFLNIQNQFYIIDRLDKNTIFQLVANLLDVSQLEQLRTQINISGAQATQIYKLFKKISLLKESQKILRYIKFIMSPIQGREEKIAQLLENSYEQLYQYLLHGKYLSPYIHNEEQKVIVIQLLQLLDKKMSSSQNNSSLDIDVFTDTRVGKIDIFANNFKVGMYLPLFVLFAYPLLIKSKDLIDYFLRSIKKRFKGQKRQKQCKID